MRGAIAVKESGTVTGGCGNPGVPRQVKVDTSCERIALIVVEVEEACRRRFKIRKAAGYAAFCLCFSDSSSAQYFPNLAAPSHFAL